MHVRNFVLKNDHAWVKMFKYGFLHIWGFSINFCRLLVGFRFKLFSTTLKLLRSEVLWGFEKNWPPIQLCLVHVVAKSCSESKFCYVELMYKKWLFATNISSAECRGKSAKQHKQTVLAFWSFTEPETKFWTTKFENIGFCSFPLFSLMYNRFCIRS